MIVALAGRRIDAVDAEIRRFPVDNVERVRRALRDFFVNSQADVLVSSAACGADLLALEEAGKLGIRRRVVLPFSPQEFLESSVADRPGEWAAIYDRVIEDVTATRDLILVEPESHRDEAYRLASEAILNEAAEIAKASDDMVTAVLVWDSASRGERDITDAFRADAERRGFPVVTVLTLGAEIQKPSQRVISGASSPN